MEFDVTKRLRTSSSRNFSRPFPSPLSAGALITPTKSSKNKDLLARLPLSASHGQPKVKISHSNSAEWQSNYGNNISLSSCMRSGSSSSAYSSVDHDLGGASPILNFRPHLWRVLDRDRQVLNLDLFWPTNLDKTTEQLDEQDLAGSHDEDQTIYPYHELKPLLFFRNLQTLQLNGMLRSYQPLIWATCWLNANLSTLHLEMALEPLINVSSDIPHRSIDATWSPQPARNANDEAEYLGLHGTGVLHEEFGDGEYLDTQAIKMAQLDVAADVPPSNMRYLSIKKLALMNFVIDATPILRWFDPKKLEEIVFKFGCIDAGFYLSDKMKHVKIQSPKPVHEAKVIKPGELKVVELKKGSIVSRKDAIAGKEELNVNQRTLKSKLSHFLPRMSIKGKEDQSKKDSEKKENADSGKVVEETGGGSERLENRFSEMEIRQAKDGKTPAR